MPTTAFPPTPGPSTDITAREEKYASSLESTLALPPPALQSAAEHGAYFPKDDHSNKVVLSPDSFSGQTSSRPTLASCKNSKQIHEARSSIFPSPPTRTRKIIQMKPPRATTEAQSPNKRRKTGSASNPTSTSTTTFNQSSTSNTTSKPTKKAMRKTAHSLIERRRRSKMNEAFSTLKDMIPACRGVGEGEGNNKEMHKLDVLNAGIEYLAYLEKCLEGMNERQWEWEGKQVERKSVGGQKEDNDREEVDEEQQQHSKKRGVSQKVPAEKQDKDCGCHCHIDCHPDCPRNHNHSAHATLPPSPPPSLEPRPQEQHYSTTSRSPLYPQPDLISTNRDTDRDIVLERDPEAAATARTAAALLMLTSTDRRGTTVHNLTSPTATTTTTTTSSSSSSSTITATQSQLPNYNTASTHDYSNSTSTSNNTNQDLPGHQPEDDSSSSSYSYSARPTGGQRARFRPKASGGGLSVRDLLLGN